MTLRERFIEELLFGKPDRIPVSSGEQLAELTGWPD